MRDLNSFELHWTVEHPSFPVEEQARMVGRLGYKLSHFKNIWSRHRLHREECGFEAWDDVVVTSAVGAYVGDMLEVGTCQLESLGFKVRRRKLEVEPWHPELACYFETHFKVWGDYATSITRPAALMRSINQLTQQNVLTLRTRAPLESHVAQMHGAVTHLVNQGCAITGSFNIEKCIIDDCPELDFPWEGIEDPAYKRLVCSRRW